MRVDPRFRRDVELRANHRCEYCQIAQEDEPYFRFHIEHIIARQHGGASDMANLALACHHCNLHKGPNLAGIDPQSQTVVQLFNPRKDRWDDHFERDHVIIRGRTATGRATIGVLAMNAPDRIELRMAARQSGTSLNR